MKIIGLTGGIGSGKTTVVGFFRELGVPVYIADDAGKRLMNSSMEVRKHIIDLLGPESYQNAHPDRKYIASQVFNSAEKLEKLNQIIHPEVEKDFKNWRLSQNAPYVIYEAAILFESGGYKKCDAVILVTSPQQLKMERLQKRDQSSIDEIEARMKHQWPDEKKRPLSQFEIINKEILNTREQVQIVHEILLKPNKNWGLFC